MSRRLAEQRLGGTQASLGAHVTSSGEPSTVVRVMPDMFTLLGREQAWVPIDPRHHVGRPRVNDFFALRLENARRHGHRQAHKAMFDGMWPPALQKLKETRRGVNAELV